MAVQPREVDEDDVVAACRGAGQVGVDTGAGEQRQLRAVRIDPATDQQAAQPVQPVEVEHREPPRGVLRLAVYRHGSAPLALWEALEDELGARSIGRIFHESADRFIADVALHPARRWAFFAVNQVGVAPGGGYNTRLLGEPDCAAGVPTQSIVDVTIARDHAVLAQRLLRILRGREPALTLGTGHSAGAVPHSLLNAGIDHRRAGGPIEAGDNHRTPYVPASGRIFDAFLALQGGFPAPPAPALLGGLSAPTIFVSTEGDRGLAGPINLLNQMALNELIDARAMNRFYTVRNVPHIDADLVWSLKRTGTDFTDPARPQYFRGGGERLKPLTAAMLDALADWVRWGVAPPRSIFNGEIQTMPDRIEFHRTSAPATAFPYVDDVDVDTYDQPPPITPGPPLRLAWANVRDALDGIVGSIVLPETACRRGSFHFFGIGPVGTHFVPFDEAVFLGRWGSAAAHNACRIQTVESLAAAGFYDPAVVTIDIEPEQFPNVVSLVADRLTVAIFSTIGFDATEIVPGSLRLASASMHGVAPHPGDVRPNWKWANHQRLQASWTAKMEPADHAPQMDSSQSWMLTTSTPNRATPRRTSIAGILAAGGTGLAGALITSDPVEQFSPSAAGSRRAPDRLTTEGRAR
jgi:hypothetical protein